MNVKSGPRLLFVLLCAMGAGPVMNSGTRAAGILIIDDLGIGEHPQPAHSALTVMG
ncbi:hypothetical protein ABIB35_003467 [Arthrobacter sp. UYP6]|uniref:hypothetical protein n=1 Tax=Arthrobacter sp. UYP6 TaxID=1756378 RepID=UPI003399481E